MKTPTKIFYSHQEVPVRQTSGKHGRFESFDPSSMAHVKGIEGENNLRKNYGDSCLLYHIADYRSSSTKPHVKGDQAHMNYNAAQGHYVNELFHEHDNIPRSARTIPKVKYDGVQNFEKGQGNAMRKTISQCPPSTRDNERLQSVKKS